MWQALYGIIKSNYFFLRESDIGVIMNRNICFGSITLTVITLKYMDRNKSCDTAMRKVIIFFYQRGWPYRKSFKLLQQCGIQ